MLNRLRARARSIFLRGQLERDMREEMSHHLAETTERLVARGMSREDAEREALREFGRMDRIQEESRDARGSRWVDETAADVRFGLRQFRRAPVSTLTMVIVLAIGIGANAALFTITYSMRTMPAPGISRDDALVRIRPIDRYSLLRTEVEQFARLTSHFSGVTNADPRTAMFTFDGPEAHSLMGGALFVTDEYFEVLGVRPLMGRTFAFRGVNGDPGSALVGIIGHETWQAQFGADLDILGRTMRVNDQVITIIGVAPPRFRGTEHGSWDWRVWIPMDSRDIVAPGAVNALSDTADGTVVARLRPGVTRESAEAAVKAISQVAIASSDLPRSSAYRGREPTADVAPLLANNAYPSAPGVIGGEAASLAMTLLILGIVCANVGSLRVGAAVVRRREIAMRLSLGATRGRVIRQLLTESVLIAIGAGVLGLLLIATIIRVTEIFLPETQYVLGWEALLFNFAFAAMTGILFGLSPALHGSRIALGEALKDSGAEPSRGRGRLQRGMVAAQIALTQPLLIALGALLLFFQSETGILGARDLADRIVTISTFRVQASTPVATPSGGIGTREAAESSVRAAAEEITRIAAALGAVPGVTHAVPHAQYGYMLTPATLHAADLAEGGRTERAIAIASGYPTPAGWLELMGIPIIAGRDFDATAPDRDTASIIIGADVAREWWGNANPVGRRILVGSESVRTVIGIVDEGATGAGMGANGARIFIPMSSRIPLVTSFRVRTSGPAEEVIPSLRSAVDAESTSLRVASVTTLSQDLEAERRSVLLASGASGGGGMLALFLAAIGLYGVVSLSVVQRTREIGIRMALGARPANVIRLFFKSGLQTCILGLIVGMPLGLGALRLLEVYLDGPRARMPEVAALVAVSVLAIASLATWIPAYRAATVDPLESIRDQA